MKNKYINSDRQETTVNIRRFASIIGFLLTISSQVCAEDIDGAMSCTIESNSITLIQDNSVKTYGGFEEGFNVGDTLILKYKGSAGGRIEHQRLGKITVEMLDMRRDQQILYFSNIAPSPIDVERGIISFDNFDERLSFDETFFEFNGKNSRLIMDRYEKDEYQGLLLRLGSFRPLYVQVSALFCTPITDNIEKLTESLIWQ